MFDPDELVELAQELVAMGDERGVTLRIIGHLAVRSHVEKHRALIDALGRLPTHDIDWMGYSKDRNAANAMFIDELGYKPDPAVSMSQEYDIQRLIWHRDDGLLVEVFLDELNMAHKLNFRGRLELDSPTITLVDLLLSKLQIVEINEKDIQDIIVLFAEHGLGPGDRELIDIDYLLKLAKNDWGLYYTSRMNLGKAREFAGHYDVINDGIHQDVQGKIDDILQRMEATPKSLKWRARARVGTKVKWYEDVGDVHRGQA
jgi:hypothetical protein